MGRDKVDSNTHSKGEDGVRVEIDSGGQRRYEIIRDYLFTQNRGEPVISKLRGKHD